MREGYQHTDIPSYLSHAVPAKALTLAQSFCLGWEFSLHGLSCLIAGPGPQLSPASQCRRDGLHKACWLPHLDCNCLAIAFSLLLPFYHFPEKRELNYSHSIQFPPGFFFFLIVVKHTLHKIYYLNHFFKNNFYC